MVRPWDDPELPWFGVFFGGMWLANIFYWGCNQFITQRTLAAKDVWHGQMGVVFAGFLKLLVPVLVVLPGIIAFRLYDPASGLLRGGVRARKTRPCLPHAGEATLAPGLDRIGHGRAHGVRHVAHRVDDGRQLVDSHLRHLQEPSEARRQRCRIGAVRPHLGSGRCSWWRRSPAISSATCRRSSFTSRNTGRSLTPRSAPSSWPGSSTGEPNARGSLIAIIAGRLGRDRHVHPVAKLVH